MVRPSVLHRPSGFCSGLKLGGWAHLGVRGRDGHELATTLCATELLSKPHEKCPPVGFDLLMRLSDVDAVELHTVTYDVHSVRDRGVPVELELLFHPWLFPALEYRQEASVDVQLCVFDADGVSARGAPIARYVTSRHGVAVKDKVFMQMEAGPSATVLLDPYRPVVTFWSICAAKGTDVALVTKHVLLCETATGIFRQLRCAFEVLAPATTSAVLKHLEMILVSSEQASRRLSRFMARVEGAFDGVPLEVEGKRYDGPSEPHECWEEQLRVLGRTVDPTKHTAPLLGEMIRGKVLQQLGRNKDGSGTALEKGQAVWASAPLRAKARAVHRVVTEFIHSIEGLAEQQAELLAARPF